MQFRILRYDGSSTKHFFPIIEHGCLAGCDRADRFVKYKPDFAVFHGNSCRPLFFLVVAELGLDADLGSRNITGDPVDIVDQRFGVPKIFIVHENDAVIFYIEAGNVHRRRQRQPEASSLSRSVRKKGKHMNAVEIKNLTKNYGKARGITELDLVVKKGDIFGFIGPNGAGKSTTIRTLLGLIAPTSGEAKVLGHDIRTETTEILAETGYLPSEINFYSGMKVKDVLRYSADIRRKKCDEKAKKLVERLDLDLNKKVDDLSLGNRKKVGIITALQHSPNLLILDEPTSGLDPLMQREFFEILKEENENGATVFLSSHVLSEVQTNCKTAAFIRDGRILMHDEVSKLEAAGAKKVYIKIAPSSDGDSTLDTLSQMKGLSDIEKGRGTLSFIYQGDASALISELAKYKLVDVSITEPSLEDIFMRFYEGGEGK